MITLFRLYMIKAKEIKYKLAFLKGGSYKLVLIGGYNQKSC